MMKTRRRSKAVAAVTAEASHSAETEETHSLTIVIPEGLDIDALSSLVPDADLTAPNSEAIVSVYRLLLQQVADLNATQRELDESRAEAEKKEVELDQALQDRESLSKDFEQSLESSHVDLEKYKRERDQLGTHEYFYECRVAHFFWYKAGSQSALKSRIAELENAQTSSNTDVDRLRARVDDVEREKRDLVGVISRLKQENESRDGMDDVNCSSLSPNLTLEEIQTLRSNLKEARQDYQSLESQLRELRSAETSMKVMRPVHT